MPTLLTRRDALDRTNWWDGLASAAPDTVAVPADGQVLLRVEHVALTRNVFTYGATGATLRYWEFWPVDEAGWGCLPAWGVARVIEGDVDGLPVGSRLAGLLPLGSHALLQPEAVTDAALRDGAPHRRGLMAVYQRYRRLPPDASPDQRREEQLGSLLRPLVVLAAVLGDAVLAADPAPTVAVLTSASSHTARAIARELGDGVAVVGLTSPARVDELAGTGRYAAVLGYPDIDGLAAAAPDGPGGAVIVDLAGRSDLRRRARAALAGRPVRTLAVGSTHGDPDGLQAGDGEESFLAPERMRELAAGWGPDGLTRFLEAAWQRQLPAVRGEIELLPADTRADIEAAYAEVFAGGCPLDHGHVLTVPEA